MPSVQQDETDLRQQLQHDLHGNMAHDLISELSQCSVRWQRCRTARYPDAQPANALEWAELHSLAAHVIDTLAPRLRGRC